MKIVLAPVGTRGDVQPMMALAVELIRRKHEVTLCVGENFKALIEPTGARYMPGGADAQEMMRANGQSIANPFVFLRLARNVVREQFQVLAAASVGADVVIASPLNAAGPAIARHFGARFFWAAY